jgi:hypothetical protein
MFCHQVNSHTVPRQPPVGTSHSVVQSISALKRTTATAKLNLTWWVHGKKSDASQGSPTLCPEPSQDSRRQTRPSSGKPQPPQTATEPLRPRVAAETGSNEGGHDNSFVVLSTLCLSDWCRTEPHPSSVYQSANRAGEPFGPVHFGRPSKKTYREVTAHGGSYTRSRRFPGILDDQRSPGDSDGRSLGCVMPPHSSAIASLQHV